MISKNLENLLNTQMKNEFYSAYFYLSMSAWLSGKNLSGFANWFLVQAQEERDHATMMMNYLLRVGVTPDFYAIEQPNQDFTSPMDICEKTFAHEQKVTAMIYNIMNAAQEEHDYKTIQFLQWFVTEQTEEEENAQGLIERLKISSNSESGILYIDAEMAARVYVPAVQA
ncbi:MAG: ferritin [Christensenellaceae bacterium]